MMAEFDARVFAAGVHPFEGARSGDLHCRGQTGGGGVLKEPDGNACPRLGVLSLESAG